MKYVKHLIAAAVTITVVSTGAIAFASPTTPTLPAEQQALLANGYTETNKLAGIFQKQSGQCSVMVQMTGKNYLVTTSGKLMSVASSIRPTHVVDTAALMEANCQG